MREDLPYRPCRTCAAPLVDGLHYFCYSCRDRLILGNLGLVGMVLTEFFRTPKPGLSRDDAEQEGRLGLIYAAEHFDPARGFKFSTYAATCILHEVVQAAHNASVIRVPQATHLNIRDQRRGVKMPANRLALAEHGARALSCRTFNPELSPAFARETEEPTDVAPLRAAVARLDPAERKILHERYWQGRTLKAIGDDLGVTKERARQRLVAIGEKLRGMLVS